MRPLSGRTAPVRILTSVLLPAPFAPMSACTSPGRTASDADLSATTAPYVFATPVASSRRSVAMTDIDLRVVGIRRGTPDDAGAPRRESRQGLSYSPGPLQATACSGV